MDEKPTIETLRAYCEKHKKVIGVRTSVNEKWGDYRFEQLPPADQERWIQEWFERGILPNRLIEKQVAFRTAPPQADYPD